MFLAWHASWSTVQVLRTSPEFRERAMSTIQVHEICKVRNAAVGRAGSGYSLAVFKKANKVNLAFGQHKNQKVSGE